MAPLIVLLVITPAARAVGMLGLPYLSSWSGATAVGLATMFAMTGASHFVPRRRSGFVAIVPPRVPHPGAVVALTGVLELLGAAALLAPPGWGHLRAGAAWGLTLLLIAMFPANVYASRARRSEHAPRTPLPQRTVVQCVLIAAALYVALTS